MSKPIKYGHNKPYTPNNRVRGHRTRIICGARGCGKSALVHAQRAKPCPPSGKLMLRDREAFRGESLPELPFIAKMMMSAGFTYAETQNYIRMWEEDGKVIRDGY